MSDLPEIVSVAALADMIGLGTRTIMRAIDVGDLRASQLAHRGGWVATRADVLDWLDVRANRPATPVPAVARVEAPAAPANARGAARRRSRAPQSADGTITVGADWGRKAA